MDVGLATNFNNVKNNQDDDTLSDWIKSRKTQRRIETVGPMLEEAGLDKQLAANPKYVIPSNINIENGDKFNDAVLSNDSNFIAAAKVLWQMNENAEAKKLKSDQNFYGAENLDTQYRTPYNPTNYKEMPQNDNDWGKYGIEMMGWFNYNIPHMALDTSRLSKAAPQERIAFYYMMNAYDKLGLSWNGTKRFFMGVLADPSTYLGLSILGLGVREAGKALSKKGVNAGLLELAKTASVTGTEGAAYSAIDNYMRQDVAIGAGAQEKFDLSEFLTATTIGTTASATIGAGAPAVGMAINKLRK